MILIFHLKFDCWEDCIVICVGLGEFLEGGAIALHGHPSAQKLNDASFLSWAVSLEFLVL